MSYDTFRSSPEHNYNSIETVDKELHLEKEDARQLTGSLYATFKELASEVLPQYTATTANGYITSKGEETVSLHTEHLNGTTTHFRLRLEKKGDSIQYDVPTNPPGGLCRATLINGKTGEITPEDVPAAAIISDLRKQHPELEILHELEFQGRHLTAANLADILMPNLIDTLALTTETVTGYTHQDMLRTHHSVSRPYVARTLQLHYTHSNDPAATHTIAMSVNTQPLAPETGEPIEDVNYGVRFTSQYSKKTNKKQDTRNSATIFGHSANPLYSQGDIELLLASSSIADSQSGDLLALFEQAAQELQQSQISEQSIL